MLRVKHRTLGKLKLLRDHQVVKLRRKNVERAGETKMKTICRSRMWASSAHAGARDVRVWAVGQARSRCVLTRIGERWHLAVQRSASCKSHWHLEGRFPRSGRYWRMAAAWLDEMRNRRAVRLPDERDIAKLSQRFLVSAPH